MVSISPTTFLQVYTPLQSAVEKLCSSKTPKEFTKRIAEVQLRIMEISKIANFKKILGELQGRLKNLQDLVFFTKPVAKSHEEQVFLTSKAVIKSTQMIVRTFLFERTVKVIPDEAMQEKLYVLLCKRKFKDASNLIIKNNLDINFVRDDNFKVLTLLQSAYELPETSPIVKFLLVHGANPNYYAVYLGRTPLFLACNRYAQACIQAAASKNGMIEFNGKSINMSYVTECQKQVVALFIECGAKINPTNSNGYFSQHMFRFKDSQSKKSYPWMIKVLIELAGREFLIQEDSAGWTLLDCACGEGNSDLIELLCQHKARLTAIGINKAPKEMQAKLRAYYEENAKQLEDELYSQNIIVGMPRPLLKIISQY